MLAVSQAVLESFKLQAEFQRETCQCGNQKAAGQPFCAFDLLLLPPIFSRTDLFAPHRIHFEDAYLSAKRWIREHGTEAAKQWADEWAASKTKPITAERRVANQSASIAESG